MRAISSLFVPTQKANRHSVADPIVNMFVQGGTATLSGDELDAGARDSNRNRLVSAKRSLLRGPKEIVVNARTAEGGETGAKRQTVWPKNRSCPRGWRTGKKMLQSLTENGLDGESKEREETRK